MKQFLAILLCLAVVGCGGAGSSSSSSARALTGLEWGADSWNEEGWISAASLESGGVPNIFANGTLADADEVNENFSYLAALNKKCHTFTFDGPISLTAGITSPFGMFSKSSTDEIVLMVSATGEISDPGCPTVLRLMLGGIVNDAKSLDLGDTSFEFREFALEYDSRVDLELSMLSTGADVDITNMTVYIYTLEGFTEVPDSPAFTVY